MSLLSGVQKTAIKRPPRVFLYAREKWGKSSLLAYAPSPIFFMTRGETGLLELISEKRVPETPYFAYDAAKPPTWQTLIQAVRELRTEPHSFQTLVIDTANGAETLCQDHVRKTVFGGMQKKFDNYGKGWNECRIAWANLLGDLDMLRHDRGMSVVLLAHTQIKKFDDPTAEDSYDQYKPACQEKLWDLTHKWSDCICFGHFQAETFETEGGRTKARQEMMRSICFDQSPTWIAGNRYAISGTINASVGPERTWKEFASRFGGRFSLSSPQIHANPADQIAQQEFAEPPAMIDDATVKSVEDMIARTNTDLGRFLAHYRVNTVRDLTAEQATAALKKLEKKMADMERPT